MPHFRASINGLLSWPALLPALILASGAGLAAGPQILALPADYVAARAAFTAEMAQRHGFEPRSLAALLDRAGFRQAIVNAMDRPYESMSWDRYRPLFLTPERIAGGIAFWRANADALARAQAVYGVSPETIVAIVGVETHYGQRLGDYRALDALTTLGFAYPKRADFFRGKLESFLLLQREEGLDPATVMGSYAGALGKPQFIPSSYRAFAVDFDGDGRRDLWDSNPDVIGSVANYLREHGWKSGEPVAVQATIRGGIVDGTLAGIPVAGKGPIAPNATAGQLRAAGVDWSDPAGAPVAEGTPATLIRLDGEPAQYWVGLTNFYALTRYNRSNLYAMAVHQLSQEIRARHAQGA